MKKWTYKTNESTYLKTKLSGYPYLEDMIEKYRNEIEAIEVRQAGIKSSSNYPLTGVPNDNPTGNKELLYDLMEEKKVWEKKLKKYQAELAELDAIIDSIEDETERAFIKDVYVNMLSTSKLSNKYGYDQKYIYQKIEMILSKNAKVLTFQI